jgi:hypothetical protein
MVVMSALGAGRALPPATGRFLVLITVRGKVDPRTMVRLEVLGKFKKFSCLILSTSSHHSNRAPIMQLSVFSLCSLPHPAVISFFSGSNIFNA